MTAGADAVDQIRRALADAPVPHMLPHQQTARLKALALLENVTGLARGGDVVLTAEQADLRVIRKTIWDAELRLEHARSVLDALLASAPRGEEQA